MFKEKVIEMKGSVHYLGRHADGTIFCDRTIDNTVTTVGKTQLALLAYGSGTAFTAIAIGVGTPSSTALGSESTTNGGGRRSTTDVVKTNPSAGVAQWVTTFSFTGALALTEEGIFNSGSASSGTMLASQTFAAINVVNTDTLAITHSITLS